MSYEPEDKKYNSHFYYVPEEIVAKVESQLKNSLVATVWVTYADYHTIYDIRTWLESEGWFTKWDQANCKIYVAKSKEDLEKWTQQ